jgi:hypothetical protein
MAIIDKRLLMLRKTDNVCVACTKIKAGETVMIEGRHATLDRDAPTGFKIARWDIKAGDQVFKYGASIGSATEDIAAGALVHTHNLKSDYIETYTLDKARQKAAGGQDQ